MSDKDMLHRIERIRSAIADSYIERKAAHAETRQVDIIAVSKFQPVEAMQEAMAAGLSVFGENRVQELMIKLADPRLEGAQFDMIGTLQKNKVKYIVGKVRCIQSIDRPELLEWIEKYAAARSLRQDVLLQFNYSQEVTKHGLSSEDCISFLSSAAAFPHLRVRGFMTMAAPGLTEDEQYAFFSSFAALFERTRACLPEGIERATFDQLSMGMSSDYQAALRAGSSCVRIGEGIFGRRI